MGDVFAPAIDFVLRQEGGLVDHPNDPGGLTRYGISIRFAGSIGLDIDGDGRTTRADIIGLTREQAVEIYREHFWQPIHGPDLPAPLAFAALDAAVNVGVRRSSMFLQMALGARPDGAVGPRTLAAARAKNDLAGALDEMIARRQHFYGRLPTFSSFGLGWSRRAVACHRAAFMHHGGLALSAAE